MNILNNDADRVVTQLKKIQHQTSSSSIYRQVLFFSKVSTLSMFVGAIICIDFNNTDSWQELFLT